MEHPEDQIKEIKEYARKLNSNIPAEPEDGAEEDGTLLDFVVEEVLDRVALYLNTKAVNTALNKVIARIVVGIFTKTETEHDSTSAPEGAISSMSDNGQSVSFADAVKNYVGTRTDSDLFTGFSDLLNRYREASSGSTDILQN